jgi:hypothetical protein
VAETVVEVGVCVTEGRGGTVVDGTGAPVVVVELVEV